MFASAYASIRRLPWWGQLLAFPFYGLARGIVYFVEWVAKLIASSAGSFFGTVVKGSIMAVLAKVDGVILGLGIVFMAIGLEQMGAAFMALSAIPIMLIGLAFAAKSAFAPTKKKKKKR